MKWVVSFVTGLFLALTTFYFYWLSNVGYNHIATQWIKSFYHHKTEIVQKIKEPKLLIASGSTSMFAFDSQRLSDQINMPVVNYGVAVGLGLKFILNKAKEQLKPGDIVLLPLEYKLYDDEHVPDKTLPLYLLDDPSYFEVLPIIEKISIVLFTPTTSFIEFLTPAQGEFHKDLYNSKRLNDYGDMASIEMDRIYIEHNVHKYSFPNVTPISVNARSRALITHFITWARSNNVKVIAMPPAIKHSIALADQKALTTKQHLYQFWESLGVDFIGRFDHFEFSKRHMFENPYHLNTQGRGLFMDALLKEEQLVNVVLKHQENYAARL